MKNKIILFTSIFIVNLGQTAEKQPVSGELSLLDHIMCQAIQNWTDKHVYESYVSSDYFFKEIHPHLKHKRYMGTSKDDLIKFLEHQGIRFEKKSR